MELEEVKQIVIPILREHRIRRAGIFGSFVNGDKSKPNDLDLMIELEEKINLLEFAGLKLELEEALGMKVDLVEYQSIKPSLKERILKEQISIF